MYYILFFMYLKKIICLITYFIKCEFYRIYISKI